MPSRPMPTHLASVVVIATVSLLLLRRRSMRRRLQQLGPEEALRAGLVKPVVLARLPSEVTGRPWYQNVVVSDVSAALGYPSSERVIGLHLGSEDNPPESLIALEHNGKSLVPIPGVLLKQYARYSLLAFSWLSEFEYGSRALLIGLGAGSLVHYWKGCVRGGATLKVDAIELDGAVLCAARAYLGFGACEEDGRVRAYVADGAEFVRTADDEVYQLIMCDLDIGMLVQPAEGEEADGAPAQANGEAKRIKPPVRADPTRDMYRALTERGLLVINEYSEEVPSVRLQRLLRCVRELRRFFPEVHVLRPTTQNTLFFAPVERSPSPNTFLREAAAQVQLPGVDLKVLLDDLPPNRYQIYSE